MTPRPPIFISAVSKELKSARQLVANTLIFLGYQPVWQDIFGTESGDLRGLLRKQIDQCKGVVQLVGQSCGAEPSTPDEEFGRVSYTQYEALYARQRGKKIWYLLLDENFAADPHESEPDEKRGLQTAYRERVQADMHLYHPLNNHEALENRILKLRDELARLRRGVKQWAIAVAVLLVLSVGLGVGLLQRQQRTEQAVTAINEKMDKVLRQGVIKYADVETQMRLEHPNDLEERTYVELAKQLGVDWKVLRETLPGFAEQLKHAPNATTYERANAAFIGKAYAEAERLALKVVDEAQKASPPLIGDAAKAFNLAVVAHVLLTLNAFEKRDIDQFVGCFADHVDYQGFGDKDRAFIRKDIEDGFKILSFTFKLTGPINAPISVYDTDQPDVKRAVFNYDFVQNFKTSTQSRPATQSGSSTTVWLIQRQGSLLQIISTAVQIHSSSLRW